VNPLPSQGMSPVMYDGVVERKKKKEERDRAIVVTN